MHTELFKCGCGWQGGRHALHSRDSGVGCCPHCLITGHVVIPKLHLTVPLEKQIAAVSRELALRQKCYPGWVAARRMTQAKAEDEITAMQAVLETLQAQMPETPKQVGLPLDGQ